VTSMMRSIVLPEATSTSMAPRVVAALKEEAQQHREPGTVHEGQAG
jgi:hypothetical protein